MVTRRDRTSCVEREGDPDIATREAKLRENVRVHLAAARVFCVEPNLDGEWFVDLAESRDCVGRKRRATLLGHIVGAARLGRASERDSRDSDDENGPEQSALR